MTRCFANQPWPFVGFLVAVKVAMTNQKIMDRRVLSGSEIRAGLDALQGWQMSAQGEITKTFTFKDFARALDFVNSVGQLAEQMDHHPDIDIRWNKVTLALA